MPSKALRCPGGGVVLSDAAGVSLEHLARKVLSALEQRRAEGIAEGSASVRH